MKLVTPQLIADMLSRATASPRLRSHHNLHEVAEDPVQRLWVAVKRDSYFRVHKHPQKWEFSVVVSGLLDVLVFDDSGVVTERIRVGPGSDVLAFELPPNTFHTWLPLAEESVFFEVKQGPYDPQSAAEFAAWAPAEGTAEAPAFAARLQLAKVGDRIG
ncbi:MAG TPA: WbuC family cupin fold metalloprotein [Spongiibacteraceae bacterium]|nr:WbuC family cupin fold metalloprotein [Spongiibacteraceae bacterium]